MWTGVIGELAADDGIADLSATLTILYSRIGVIRFSRSYAIDKFVFVTDLAHPLPQWLSIFRPFKSESMTPDT